LSPAHAALTHGFYERVSRELCREIEKHIDYTGMPKIHQGGGSSQRTLKGPIVFVAYGDAGIVVEMALIAAHEELEKTLKSDAEELAKTFETHAEELDRARSMAGSKELQKASIEEAEKSKASKKLASISHLTAGIIFLATPFSGSNRFVKHLGKLIGRAATPSEQEYLGAKSKLLEVLSMSFKEIITSLGIQIWCFQASDMVIMILQNNFHNS